MAIGDFENLAPGTFQITSPPTPDYNCIAWAVRDTDRWWWPDPDDGHWPEGAPVERTVDAFIKAFATKEFAQCDDGSPEEGFEKIAVYANADGPTHAARLLDNEKWASKLGPDEDIEHDTLDRVAGQRGYGKVVCFLKRPTAKNP